MPLEIHRLDKLRLMEEDHLSVKLRFTLYHTRSKDEADRITSDIGALIEKLREKSEKLGKLKPQGEAEQLFRGLILYLQEL